MRNPTLGKDAAALKIKGKQRVFKRAGSDETHDFWTSCVSRFDVVKRRRRVDDSKARDMSRRGELEMH